MKYVGSKNKHAKHILPIIMAHRSGAQAYVEPFVGGANCIDKAWGKRIGFDNHRYLIKLLCAVRDGWEPPDLVNEDGDCTCDTVQGGESQK